MSEQGRTPSEDQLAGNAAASSALEVVVDSPPGDTPTLEMADRPDTGDPFLDELLVERGALALDGSDPSWAAEPEPLDDAALGEELLEQWRLERDTAAIGALRDDASDRFAAYQECVEYAEAPGTCDDLADLPDVDTLREQYAVDTESPRGMGVAVDVAMAMPSFLLGIVRSAGSRLGPNEIEVLSAKLERGGAAAITHGLPEFVWGLGEGVAQDIRDQLQMLVELPVILEAVDAMLVALRGPAGAEFAFAMGVDIGLGGAGELLGLLEMSDREVAQWIGRKIGPLLTDTMLCLIGLGGLYAAKAAARVLVGTMGELKAVARFVEEAMAAAKRLDGAIPMEGRRLAGGPDVIPDTPAHGAASMQPRDPGHLDALYGRGQPPPAGSAAAREAAQAIAPDLESLVGQPWSDDLADALRSEGYVVYELEDGTTVVRRSDITAQDALSVQDGQLMRGLRSGAPSTVVPKGTRLGEVLTQLREGSSSWTQYEDMLTAHFDLPPDEIERGLREVLGGDVTPDDVVLETVRHKLKKHFEPRVLDELDALSPQASHAKLLEMTRGLNGSDKGTLAEQWYQRTFLRDEASGELRGTRHPKLGKEANGGALKDRFPDLVDGGVLHEVKAGRGELTPREIEQFEDYMGAVTKPTGGEVTKGGKPVQERVKKAVYTFVDPEGARVNAELIDDWLRKYPELSVEVFDTAGAKRTFGGGNLAEFWRFVGET